MSSSIRKMAKTILAFDVYGTLLSTESVAGHLSEHFGKDGKSIATSWRRHQIEYTFRLNIMGKYDPFSVISKNALSQALAEHGQSLPTEASSKFVDVYNHLPLYPDVYEMLEKLATYRSLQPVLFSNATEEMMSQVCSNLEGHFQCVCPRPGDQGQHEKVFDDAISVETVGKYKPAPETYWHLAERMGKSKTDKTQMEQMWLISGHPWDIMGALNVGMKAAFVDREGHGWVDAVDPEMKPTITGKDMNELLDAIVDRVGCR